MKSSSIHRNCLSKEKMSMIENVKPQTYESTEELDQYMKSQKKPELDVLWRDFEKTLQTKSKSRTPIVYIGIGFIAGLLFALGIALIIGVSMYSDAQQPEFKDNSIKIENSSKPSVATPSNIPAKEDELSTSGLEEKYTVKSGDTLEEIAHRFYGEYNPEKVDRIMKLNNIKDETRIQIDQVLIIPLD